jgi:lysosomal Pro-X carboxypeptidase
MIMLLLVFLATSLTSVSSLLPKSLNSAWLPTSISFKHTPTSADCRLSYFTQPLDHFNTTNSKTLQKRYFWNATYFKPNGPILYYTGNEADVTLYVNATGLMWENAEELGALLVFGEHRYYGETLPFDPPFAPAQLKWLSVEQSLADHVRLVKHIKKTITGAENSKVVAIGGSYGGMQSSWIRMRYPNIIDGAIAASAPILAFDGVSKENAKRAGAESYWKIVTDDATEAFGSTANCASNVRRSWMAMDKMFSTGHEGKKKLQTLFSLCKEPSTLVELVALKTYLQMAFDTMAMGNFPFPSSYLASGVAVLPAYPFRKACSYLGNKNDTDDALLRNLGVAAAVFNNATLKLQCFELPLDPDYDGIWDYMWCTDTLCQETYFGRNGVDDMFWSFQYDEHAINVHCKMKYGITPSYYNIKEQFGGIDGVRNSSNIVFSNGRFDPWRSGGVTSINSTERSIWSIVIPNGAHVG